MNIFDECDIQPLFANFKVLWWHLSSCSNCHIVAALNGHNLRLDFLIKGSWPRDSHQLFTGSLIILSVLAELVIFLTLKTNFCNKA